MDGRCFGLSILVTGPDTLLGNHISRVLTDSGLTVRLLAPAGSDQADYDVPGAAVTIATSQTLDTESCLTALEGCTGVFHCESGRLSPASSADATPTVVEGTRNLLLSMSRLGVEDLVLAGSAFVFAPGTLDEPGDETAAWDNQLAMPCLDAIRASSDLAQRYADDGRVRCVTVSPSLMMGDHDRPGSAGWWFLDLVAAGTTDAPPGSVNIVRAADAAAAAVKALGRGKAGQSFIIGGENVTYDALFSEAALALGVSTGPPAARDRATFARLRPGRRKRDPLLRRLAGTDLCYDAGLARAELGLAVTPARETISEAASWFTSHRESRGRAG